MAQEYDNTNSFALFKNNKTKETQPDYTGRITLEGNKEKRLSAWLRQDKNGNSYMSGQMSESYDASAASATESNGPVETITDMKDDVPF